MPGTHPVTDISDAHSADFAFSFSTGPDEETEDEFEDEWDDDDLDEDPEDDLDDEEIEDWGDEDVEEPS